MIPIANQVMTRAGPATGPSARGTEAVADPSVHGQGGIRPVEQAETASKTFQRGRDDLDRSQDAASVAVLRLRAKRAKTASVEPDAPQDRAVFRAKVIRFLQSIYHDDNSFQRAVERGTLIIRAVEDMPEPELRPEIAYAIYRQGAMQSGRAAIALDLPDPARVQPHSVGISDFVAWWPK